MKKLFSMMSVLMLVAMLFVAMPTQQASAANIWTVCASGCDYTTIQAAITAAAPGDTITVGAGTYDEKLTVGKSITLQGAGASLTSIAPSAPGDYSLISVSNPGGDVKIDGFNFVMPVFPNYGSAIVVTDVTGAIDANTVTISNNVVTGSGNGSIGTDFGFYGQGNNAKLIIDNNILNYTGSNSIMMEQQLGTTEVTNNTVRISNDVYYDPIFSMVYNNKDVTTPQIVSGNTIYLDHSGLGYSTAITFMAAPSFAPDPKDAHYRDIQILNNTIYTGGAQARGMGVSDKSSSTTDSLITGVVITGNTIIGESQTDLNTRGILLEGNIQGAVISDNEVHDVLNGVVIAPGVNNGVYPTGTTIQNNRIVNNGTGLVWNNSLATLNASPNWWGTADKTTIASHIVGSVTFEPYYIDSAMTTLSSTLPTVVYVDGTFVDGAAGGHIFGYDAFATIQDGINGVAAGGTVHVAAGIYAEKNIKILKSMTLLGDPGDDSAGPGLSAPVIDGGLAYGDAFLIENGVTNVTIAGFEIRNYATNEFDGVGNAVSAWEASTSNITIRDNYLHNLQYNGILVGNDGATGDHTNWLVKGNIIESFGYIGFELTNTSNSTIEDNVIHMSTPYIGAIFSSARRSESGLTIKNNLIDGTSSTTFPTIYVYAYDLDVPNPQLDSVLIEGNTITTTGTTMDIYIRNIGTGTVTGVQVNDNTLRSMKNLTTEVIDASPNWWGTADKTTIASHIVGSVTFEPYYIDSAMTTLSSTLPTVVYVDGTFVDGAAGGHIFGYDAFATIQAGIDGVAAGGTVNVAPGTYNEQLSLNKANITVKSTGGRDVTILDIPDGELTIGVDVLKDLGNVTFDGFTVKDFTESGIVQRMSQRPGTAFHVLNNAVIPAGTYLRNGIQVSGDGSTVIGNHVVGARLTEEWESTAIHVVNASNVVVADNTITGDPNGLDVGIAVDNWDSAIPLQNLTITDNTIDKADNGILLAVYVTGSSLDDVTIEDNKITNFLLGVRTDLEGTSVITNLDASPNWWGSAMGPGDGMSINVGFSPWCANPECTAFGTLVDAGTDIQELLDDANPGDIIILEPGVFSGGLVITTPGLTIIGQDGVIVGSGSPPITIQADNVSVENLTINCDNEPVSGIVLQHDSLPLNNVVLQNLEITECKTGIEVATPVTNIKLVSNWIHTNTDDGLLFQKPASVSGDTTLIAGNLFKVNGGFGIQNLNANTVDARYNSWGATSVTAGDKVKGKVNVGNATYAEVFLDVKPVTNATLAKVAKGATFPVALRVDARALFGVEAKVAYDPELLTYMVPTPGNFKGTGVCEVTDSNPVGVLTVVCRKAYANADATGVLTLVNLNFTANGPDLSAGDLYETSFDVYDVNAADRNGMGVYVNNGGFNDPSAWGIRTIIDSDDGMVQISTNFSFTGYIALQGRTDNSGAVMSIYATSAPASLIAGADGLSISDGNYWAMSPDLLLKKTYYLKADAPLYLPTTSATATAIKHYKILGANVLPLKKVVLLGGDASNNDKVDLADATCIAATYNLDPAACGADPASSTDVNGDGLVNLLDLVMVGSSFNRTSSPWVP